MQEREPCYGDSSAWWVIPCKLGVWQEELMSIKLRQIPQSTISNTVSPIWHYPQNDSTAIRNRNVETHPYKMMIHPTSFLAIISLFMASFTCCAGPKPAASTSTTGEDQTQVFTNRIFCPCLQYWFEPGGWKKQTGDLLLLAIKKSSVSQYFSACSIRIK